MMQLSRVEAVQGDEKILLYGIYTVDGITAKRSCISKMSFTTSINSASAVLTLTLKAARVKKYNTATMTVGDPEASQRILVYLTNGTNEQLAYNLLVSGYEESRSTATLTATHDGINIAQNRKEFIVPSKEDGTVELISDILIPLIKSASGDGKTLTVSNGSSYSAKVRQSHYIRDSILYQAHGQLIGELINHLLITTYGCSNINPEAEYPVVMYADLTDPDNVILADFSCGAGSVRSNAVEISYANGTIVGNVDLTKANKECAINRAYFYRTVEATYDDQGNIITPGQTYKLYECIHGDTIKEYGERSILVTYPEWIDTGEGGTEVLLQTGIGICRANSRPQNTLKVTCDAKLILDSAIEPLNRVFHIIDDSKSKDYGEMVCINYTLEYPKMQITMTLAPNNPYVPSELADTLSLTEQRLSNVEAKTLNLTCELTAQIGSALASRFTIDCDKYWDARSISGIKFLELFGDISFSNKLPRSGIISPDPSNPDDWIDHVSLVDGVDVSDHNHSGGEMGNKIRFNDLDISNGADLQYQDISNVNDVTILGNVYELSKEESNKHVTKRYVDDALERIYPVGSLYFTTSPLNPADMIGFGTWERYAQGRTIIGEGTSDQEFTTGTEGGESSHKLTVDEIPAHKHTGSAQDAGSHSHSGFASAAGSHGHGYTKPSSTRGGSFGDGGGYDSTASGTTDSAGFHSHDLSVNSGGSHTHRLTIENSGGGRVHNNLPPFVVTYIWTRTA